MNMKYLQLLVLIFFFSVSNAQKTVIPIHIFEDRKEFCCNDTISFFLQKHFIPYNSSKLMTLSNIVDTIKILKKKNISFTIVSREIKYKNFDCYNYSQYTTYMNSDSKKKLKRKLLFGYISEKQDKEGNSIIYFYSVE